MEAFLLLFLFVVVAVFIDEKVAPTRSFLASLSVGLLIFESQVDLPCGFLVTHTIVEVDNLDFLSSSLFT